MFLLFVRQRPHRSAPLGVQQLFNASGPFTSLMPLAMFRGRSLWRSAGDTWGVALNGRQAAKVKDRPAGTPHLNMQAQKIGKPAINF